MTKTKQKEFSVTARIIVITSIPVVAASLEEAVAKSKGFDTTDFIEIPGEHCDSSCEVVAVSNNADWNTD